MTMRTLQVAPAEITLGDESQPAQNSPPLTRKVSTAQELRAFKMSEQPIVEEEVEDTTPHRLSSTDETAENNRAPGHDD